MVYSRHRDGGAVHCRREAFGRSQGAGFSGCGFPEGLGNSSFQEDSKTVSGETKTYSNSFFGSFVFGLLGGGLNTLVVFHCLKACENNPINRTHDLPLTLWQVFEHSSVGQGSM